MGQSREAVEETGRRHRETDAGLLRQVTGDRGRVTRVLFVPERENAYARGLRETAQIRDRDAGHAIDRVDVVELERVDEKVKAVGERHGLFCPFGLDLRCHIPIPFACDCRRRGVERP